MYRRITIAVVWCVVTYSALGMTLAKDGTSDYVIVRPADCSPVVETAVADLQRYLAEVSGATLPVQSDADPLPRKAILVGKTHYLNTLGVAPDWSRLGDEGYLITTKGPYLIIVGGPERGSAYGVYAFLDEQLRCRWFTPDVARIPKRRTIHVGQLHDTYTPPLMYREVFWVEARGQDWNLRNRIDASNIIRLDEAHGGGVLYFGVHTFYQFVPPDKYFAAHPEYYSLIDGQRTCGLAQLCLTNPDVLQIVINGVRDRLRGNPDIHVVDVSQNDCYNPCQCDACQAIAKREESEAGPVIWFVNQVADAIRPEFPDQFVGTLAYQYTRKAPKTLVPRDNVAPRLCSIECCFSHPLDQCTGEQNQAFVRDMQAWKSKTQHLFIWDYTTNFPYYIQPYPNLYSLQPNIRFFIDHGACGIFEQGNYQGSGGGEMAPLRAYLLARLLWKPDRDVDREIKEFLDAYYGPAAQSIYEYIRFLHHRVEAPDAHVGNGYPPTGPLFDGDFLPTASALFERAEAAVAGDPVRTLRVKQCRMPVDFVIMMRLPDQGNPPPEQVAQATAAAKRFFSTADACHTDFINEGMGMDAFRASYLASRGIVLEN